MPSEEDLARWQRIQRSAGSDDTGSIISGLSLPPIPAEVKRAFPSFGDWEQQANETLRQFMTKLTIAIRGSTR